MGELTANGRLTNLLRFLRYLLSPPRFDPKKVPATLVIAPNPGFFRIRTFAACAALLLAAILAIGVYAPGTIDGMIDAALGLVAAISLAAVLTFLPKRLEATFGERDVNVSEGGIRAPRAAWSAPIAAFSGLAWRRHDFIERNESFQILQKTEVRRRAVPIVTEFHWIELVHPEPAKTLILCFQKGDTNIAERLKAYSQRLNRPILTAQPSEGI